MRFSAALALGSAALTNAAALQGFNYGSTNTDGSIKVQQDFVNEFNRARNLQGTSGFTSARLYTMIQGGTANTVISAIPAAISTKTTLLLGLWASAGQANFDNEVTALKNAINQYGTAFTDLIAGISVGSEDLYRVSPTGIENKSGAGASPDELVRYINQVRSAIQGTSAAGKGIGHVDTWTAWVNGSNSAVNQAVDWLGFDGYPYFQTTQANGIENAQSLLFDSYNATVGAALGKPVWITETGWPVSGPVAGQGVANTQNAETYWQEVACRVLGNINTFWYTLQDAYPTTPSPSFGIVGTDLNSAPLYDLTCKNGNQASSSSAVSSRSAAASSSVASPTKPTSAAASSSVSIVTTPGAETSPASVSLPVTSQPAVSGSVSASNQAPASSSAVSAVTSSSVTVVGGQTHTIFSTKLVTITSCPTVCPTGSASSSPAAPGTKSASASGSASASSSRSASASSAPSASASSCPTNLSGQYEYPHLIVPIDSANPSKVYGTSYNGTISPTVSSIFNFDVPASTAGKTCSLVFLFPVQAALETSAFTFNGQGGLKIDELSAVATAGTTFDNAPAKSGLSQTIASVAPGNSYSVFSHECGAGKAVAFEFSSVGGLDLNYFQDYNPSPIGAYITVC